LCKSVRIGMWSYCRVSNRYSRSKAFFVCLGDVLINLHLEYNTIMKCHSENDLTMKFTAVQRVCSRTSWPWGGRWLLYNEISVGRLSLVCTSHFTYVHAKKKRGGGTLTVLRYCTKNGKNSTVSNGHMNMRGFVYLRILLCSQPNHPATVGHRSSELQVRMYLAESYTPTNALLYTVKY